MKFFKKFLFAFLILFAFSFGERESKIYLDSQREPAKLKIGVTKIKSKELPLNVMLEEKRLFGEIVIDDNDLIYVSETLNEMPSVTTSNGKRTINNIKKYLTKDIKEDRKFNYQIKKDEETGKKYLVIDCKTEISGIYAYVVERGTYKVKEVYKGVFHNPIPNIETKTTYGTIHFGANHTIALNNSKSNDIFYNGGITFNGVRNNNLTLEGTYPKIYKTNNFGHKNPKVKLEFENIVTGKKFNIDRIDYDPNSGSFATMSIGVYDNQANTWVGNIEVSPNTEKEYLKFSLKNWNYRFSQVDAKISIIYEYKDGILGSFEVAHIDTFNLKIDKKQGMLLLGDVGNLTIAANHNLNLRNYYSNNNKVGRVTTNDGSQFSFENVNVSPKKNVSYIHSTKFLKKPVLNDGTIDWYKNEENAKLRVTVGDISDTYSLNVNTGIHNAEGRYIDVKDISGTVIGNLKIYSTPNSDYMTLDFGQWKPFQGDVDTKVTLEYLAINPNNGSPIETVVRRDTLDLKIYKRVEELKDEKVTLYVVNPDKLDNAIITKYNGHWQNPSKDDVGKGFDPGQQLKQGSDILKRFINNNIDDPDNQGVIDWGTDQRVVVKNRQTSQEKIIGKNSNPDKGFDIYSGQFHTGTIKDGLVIKDINGNDMNSPNEKMTAYLDMRRYEGYKHLQLTTYGYNYKYGVTDPNKIQFVDTDITIEYQAKINGQWVTKKTDTLNFIVQPPFEEVADIKISNPIVWNAKNNRQHLNKRVFINKDNGAVTLGKNSTEPFRKNTTVDGNQWIIATGKGLKNYNWQELGAHRVKFLKNGNEFGSEITGSDGSTPSMHTIKFDKGNNSAVFFYESKADALTFGVTDYDFEGGDLQVEVIHYSGTNSNGFIADKSIYKISYPKFDGLPYVATEPNTNINPRNDYIKKYTFDTGQIPLQKQKGFELNFGKISLKGLDRRITYEFGGEGVEIRIPDEDVLLVHEKNPNFKLNGKIYFKQGNEKSFNIKDTDKNSEIEISKDVYLSLDKQDSLAIGGKFKIVKAKDGLSSPIEVGVTVNGDSQKYYKSVTDLYLEVEDRYIESAIEFHNPITVIKEVEETGKENWGWIQYDEANPYGKIIGYDGEKPWGKVDLTGGEEVVNVPTKVPFTLEIYDANNKKLGEFDSKTGGKPLEIPIGQSKMKFAYAGNNSPSLWFGAMEGYYIPGSSGVFYTRYIQKDTNTGVEKILFVGKFSVLFKSSEDVFTTLIYNIKNPAMVSNETTTSEQGMIYTNSGNAEEGITFSNGNNNTSKDSIDWWSFSGRVGYPETLFQNYDTYIEYDNHKIPLALDEKKILTFPNNNAKVKVGFKNINGEIAFGAGYIKNNLNDGTEIKNLKFKINWYTKGTNNLFRSDEIITNVDRFDPRYYGTIYPTGKDDITNYGKVGSGEETIKDISNIGNSVTIDLGTTYRNFMRYPGYVNILGHNNLDNFITRVIGDVEILPKGMKNATPIKGNLKLVKDTTTTDTIKIFNNSLDTSSVDEYKLKVELSKEEYVKLNVNTTYEIFYNNKDKHTLEIGFRNESSPKLEKLPFDNPLNFRVKPSPFKITTTILDFGIINLYGKNENDPPITTGAISFINVSGNSPGDFKLELEGGDTTKIYQNTGSGQASNVSLDVSKLKLTEGSSSSDDFDFMRKQYLLSGILTVPMNTTPGQYTGHVVVNVTMITE